MRSKKTKHADFVFVLCNPSGPYSITFYRGKKKRNYKVKAERDVIDMLSKVGNYNTNYRMTIEMSIFPSITIFKCWESI